MNKMVIIGIIILIMVGVFGNFIEHKITEAKIQYVLDSQKHSELYTIHEFDCRHMCIETETLLEAYGYDVKIVYNDTWFQYPEYGHVWLLIYINDEIYPVAASYDESMGFVVKDTWDTYPQYFVYSDIYENGEDMAAIWM